MIENFDCGWLIQETLISISVWYMFVKEEKELILIALLERVF